MRNYINLLILSLFIVTILTACTFESTSANKVDQDGRKEEKSDTTKNLSINKDTPELTIDKIKEKYETERIGRVVDTSTYGIYVLVEYLNEADRQCFDLYNLKTSERDIMPLNSKGKVFQFASGDNITFISDGINPMNGHRHFPFYMVCSREKEITGYDADFQMSMRDLYKRIEEGFEFGVKKDILISDLRVTLTGLEVLFAPMEGKEAGFYAGYTTIPVVNTSYVPNKKQFILEFKDTKISPKFKERIIKEQNNYITSIELKEKGANTIVTIYLKDTAKFYNAKVDHSEPSDDKFPYVRFTFRNSIFN